MATATQNGTSTEKADAADAYLDATPLVKAVLASPRSWPTFIRSQIHNLRRPA